MHKIPSPQSTLMSKTASFETVLTLYDNDFILQQGRLCGIQLVQPHSNRYWLFCLSKILAFFLIFGTLCLLLISFWPIMSFWHRFISLGATVLCFLIGTWAFLQVPFHHTTTRKKLSVAQLLDWLDCRGLIAKRKAAECYLLCSEIHPPSSLLKKSLRLINTGVYFFTLLFSKILFCIGFILLPIPMSLMEKIVLALAVLTLGTYPFITMKIDRFISCSALFLAILFTLSTTASYQLRDTFTISQGIYLLFLLSTTFFLLFWDSINSFFDPLLDALIFTLTVFFIYVSLFILPGEASLAPAGFLFGMSLVFIAIRRFQSLWLALGSILVLFSFIHGFYFLNTTLLNKTILLLFMGLILLLKNWNHIE